MNAKVGNMIVLVLLGVLALVVGGCVSVVWAERGGPLWVRAVATLTLAAGEAVRRSARNRRSGVDRTTSDDG
jgi:ABC-type nickel/cobalt efflux system permease component RcnA